MSPEPERSVAHAAIVTLLREADAKAAGQGPDYDAMADALLTSLAMAALTISQDLTKAKARITELEGAFFGAGLLYGFECKDGLPCWCEPNERAGPHTARCADLRAVLAPKP